ncbi:MAG: hypothetical protein V1850_00595 [Candidatus Bathyarchaeota archaeon]
MSDKGKLKIHVEFGELRADFEGNPDEVARAFLTSLSNIYPCLELATKLVFQPDLSRLADSLVGLVKFAPEGLLVLTGEAPAEETIIISLVGNYVGYRLGKIESDTDSANGMAKTTGKALKTISNQLAWMIDDGLVERVGRGSYRITSLGIRRFEQITAKSRTERGIMRSETPFTVHVKIGNYEMELTGSRGDVAQALDELPKIVAKVMEAFNQTLKASTVQESAKVVEEDFPTIGAQIGISCPEAIVAILSTAWGREKPRNLGEIMEAMKVNALHFPGGTVKGRLTDLTKKGMLRRIRGEKGYGYVVVK